MTLVARGLPLEAYLQQVLKERSATPEPMKASGAAAMSVFVDTNVLLRATDPGDPKHDSRHQDN